MRVLITGGAGFIGSHLTEALLALGHHVTIIDDLSTGSMDNLGAARRSPNFHFAIETVLNAAVLDRLVSECDLIVHLASAVGVDLIVQRPVEVIERCVLGTEAVFRTAKRYGKKTILASSSEVYGKNTKVPFDEEDDRTVGSTTRNRWSYACSKAIDEFLGFAYHHEYGLPIVVVRLFNTIGPRQLGRYGMVVPRFVRAALDGDPIRVFGDGSQTRCFCDVSDVVTALSDLLDHPEAVGHVYNIGTDEEISIMGLAEKVRALCDSASEIQTVPYSEAYEAGFEDMKRRVPGLTRIRDLIGFEPQVRLDEAILRIRDHMRAATATTSG